MTQPYPLDHWLSVAGPMDTRTQEGLRAALEANLSSDVVELEPGVRAWALSGAGTHSAFAVEVDGRQYCLKQFRTGGEQALRREVGGMCFLASQGVRRAPVPYSWSSSPAYAFTDLVPGQHLGNKALTSPQLGGIVEGTKELYRIQPCDCGEALWEIDWHIEAEVWALEDRYGQLVARTHTGDLEREAIALIGGWLESPDPARFLAHSDRVVFSRGDQNLANSLWDGRQIRFVDLEDCGWNDIARDLSLVTDHIQSYATPIADWEWYIDQFGLTREQRARTLAARRRLALSWLSIECLNPGALYSVPAQELLERLLERADALCRVAGE